MSASSRRAAARRCRDHLLSAIAIDVGCGQHPLTMARSARCRARLLQPLAHLLERLARATVLLVREVLQGQLLGPGQLDTGIGVQPSLRLEREDFASIEDLLGGALTRSEQCTRLVFEPE